MGPQASSRRSWAKEKRSALLRGGKPMMNGPGIFSFLIQSSCYLDFFVSCGINPKIQRLSLSIRKLLLRIERKSLVFKRLRAKIKRFSRFTPFRRQLYSAHFEKKR
jgi:hypothetical protein